MDDRTKAVLAMEERRIGAITTGNIEALAALLGDDLVYIHNNGMQETKAQYLKTASAIKYKAFKPSDVRVRWFGDTGILNGTAAIEVNYQGKDMAMRVRYTAVYAQQAGAWQLVSWHASAVQQQ